MLMFRISNGALWDLRYLEALLTGYVISASNSLAPAPTGLMSAISNTLIPPASTEVGWPQLQTVRRLIKRPPSNGRDNLVPMQCITLAIRGNSHLAQRRQSTQWPQRRQPCCSNRTP